MKAIVLGAGGHARVVASVLRQRRGLQLAGFTDAARELWGRVIDGVKVLGGDEKAGRPGAAALFNGLGVGRDVSARRRLYESLKARGHRFPALVAASAVVDRTAELGNGCQILTRAVVHPGASIGENAVINTSAVVEHDCRVGAHAFVSPGAVLLGAAQIGAGAFVGAGACVLIGVKIGEGAVVAAGAVVLHDVPNGGRVAGVPAKPMR